MDLLKPAFRIAEYAGDFTDALRLADDVDDIAELKPKWWIRYQFDARAHDSRDPDIMGVFDVQSRDGAAEHGSLGHDDARPGQIGALGGELLVGLRPEDGLHPLQPLAASDQMQDVARFQPGPFMGTPQFPLPHHARHDHAGL